MPFAPGSPAAALLDSAARALRDADCLQSPDEGIHAQLWRQLREMGAADAHLPEYAQELGGGWGVLVEISRLCGRAGARVPLARHALGAWLTARCGGGKPHISGATAGRTADDASPDSAKPYISGVPGALALQPLAPAALEDARRPSATSPKDPRRRSAEIAHLDWPGAGEDPPATLLAVVHNPPREDGSSWGCRLALLDIKGAEPQELGANLAGEPRAALALDGAPCLGVFACDDMAPLLPLAMAALLRAGAMAGAMEAAVSLALDHVGVREQFGRPLAKFQAIQQQLAAASVQAASVAAACAWAAGRLDDAEASCAQQINACAVAKARAGAAAAEVLDACHQSHGAIGFTQEYALGRFSRRLWSWRAEDGDSQFWHRHLGRAARGHARQAQGPGGLWDFVTSL